MSEFTEIKGVVPVLSTPLDSDRKLDAKTLRREIEWVGEHGVKSVASGMVSEILRMNLRERKELTESICASAADFKMNSIVSCGQETPEHRSCSTCSRFWCRCGNDQPAYRLQALR